MNFNNMTRAERRAYIKMKKRRRNLFVTFLVLLCAVTVVGTVYGIKYLSKGDNKSPAAKVSSVEEPKGPTVTAEAVVGNSGDILIHQPILKSAKSGEKYDFEPIFQFVKPYVEECDYATVNAEFSIGTKEQFDSAEMVFRVPDTVVDALQYAGFDFATTANNHTNDGGESGFIRTMDTLKEKGMEFTGTRPQKTDPIFKVVDVNGIKIGMINYSYGSFGKNGVTKYLNGIPCSDATNDLVNVFSVNDLDRFYSEMEQAISEMREAGAETITLYIHWGDEYHLTPNTYQTSIAQKMCDLGVDTIIGGHPHKVQPADLITSTDGSHKTTCIYSMGNFLSNQVVAAMVDVMGNKQGYTEDGVIYKVHYKKYSDGTVKVAKISVIPTWVYRKDLSSGLKQYRIIPLKKSELDNLGSKYNLGSSTVTKAKKSYKRTMGLLSEGIKKCNQFLAEDNNNFLNSFK